MSIISPMSTSHSTEARFLGLFRRYFLGADISGKPGSGFVNLLRMKKRHFKAFEQRFHRDMGKAISDAHAEIGPKNSAPPPPARDKLRADIFNKLHAFFSRYFSESGSVYFCSTPKWQPIFERLRAPERDVSLVWRTSDLYYVKSDTLIRSMTVSPEDSDAPLWMDASNLPPKQNNERRDLLFKYAGPVKKEGRFAAKLTVSRAVNGAKTDFDGIAKQINKDSSRLQFQVSGDEVREAVAVFRRQTEADFFIHKNAGRFLREQLDMFLFHYLVGGGEETKFGPIRLAEIRALQKIARLVIGFVAEFEDELRRVWEKPKFVRGVQFPDSPDGESEPRRERGANYVVTLDKLPPDLRRKAASHSGAKAQIAEWRGMGLVEKGFTARDIPIEDGGKPAPKKKGNGNGKNGDLRFLPLDTRHFKSLELEILAALAAAGGLDAALDGELIHSENWQALNVLRHKHAGRVKCVYIDPPFNLESGDQFAYRTNYKDSCWATMLENRLALVHKLIAEDGGIFVRCDHNGDWIVRCVMDEIFGADNFKNDIVVNRTQEFYKSPSPRQRKLMNDVDRLFLYGKSEDARVIRLRIERGDEVWHEPFLPGRNGNGDEVTHDSEIRMIDGKAYRAPTRRMWGLSQEDIDRHWEAKRIRIENGRVKYWPLWRNVKNNWTDIPGYARTWEFNTENAEELIKRSLVIMTAGDSCGAVMDFFAGSGSTLAVAHKLGRKWIGVEMGDHFHSVVLRRMKAVLAGDQTGVSAEKEVQHKGGGAFKYYALEQYEESLAKTRRQDDPPEHFEDSAYIFHKDEKMTWAAEVRDKRLRVLLDGLYSDIDLAETLSQARGLPIWEKTADKVALSDGEPTEEFPLNPAKMSEEEKKRLLAVLKPYLWW